MHEIVVPHDPSRGPLVAVRRMLVHSSIAELEELGQYERYRTIVDDESLSRIMALIGPGWMPVDLTLAHYEACDRLALPDEVIDAAGTRAGGKMADALLVAGVQPRAATAERTPWDIVGALSRMGRRLYEGSSAQYVKLGQNVLQIEYIGNPLFALRYYRLAHRGFMREAFSSVGVDVAEVKLSPYRVAQAQIDCRMTWR